MAARKTATAAAAAAPEPVAPNIDPETTYRVVLAGVLEIAPGVFARPRDTVTVKGKKLLLITDRVASYEEA